MTLRIGVCILQMRPYRRSVDTVSHPQDKRHGCRHPPPSARRNQVVLKIGSAVLFVTPARKTPVNPGVPSACGTWAFQGGTGRGSKPSSSRDRMFKGFEYQEVNSLEGGFAYAKHDCCHPSSRGVKEWE